MDLGKGWVSGKDKLDQNHPEALHYLGLLMAQQGQLTAAAGLLEKSLRCSPESPNCHKDLGIVFHGLERFEDAESAYRKAIELQPSFPEALCSLGHLYRDFCCLEEAVTCYANSTARRYAGSCLLNADRSFGGSLRRRRRS